MPDDPPLVVRPARDEDVAAVAQLELDAFPADPWTAAYLSAVVAGELPSVSLLVGEQAGRLLAYALVSVLFEDAELQRIGVAPHERGRGLGRTLLDAVLDHARAGRAERLLLEVRETNAAAIALYRAAGFGEIARREGYYADGTTAVVLERLL